MPGCQHQVYMSHWGQAMPPGVTVAQASESQTWSGLALRSMCCCPANEHSALPTWPILHHVAKVHPSLATGSWQHSCNTHLGLAPGNEQKGRVDCKRACSVIGPYQSNCGVWRHTSKAICVGLPSGAACLSASCLKSSSIVVGYRCSASLQGSQPGSAGSGQRRRSPRHDATALTLRRADV